MIEYLNWGVELLNKNYDRIDKLNDIYRKDGFMGVREYVLGSLLYGDFVKMDDGLYMACTGGWSEDEELISDLISLPSMFRKHYMGYICGGAFYFVENTNDEVEMKILHEKENKEECCGYVCLECGKDMGDDRRAYCSDCEPLQNLSGDGHSKCVTSDGRIFYDDPKAADRHQRRVWNEKKMNR